MKKVFAGLVVVALLLTPSFSPAQAMTRVETDALIQQLLVQVMQLQQRLLILLQQRSSAGELDYRDSDTETERELEDKKVAYKLGNASLRLNEKGDLSTTAVAYINWEPVYGASGYSLYRSTDPAVSLSSAMTAKVMDWSAQTNYAETYIRNGANLLTAGTYYYRVIPMSSSGYEYNGSSNVVKLVVPMARTWSYGSIDILTPAQGTLVFAGSSMTIRWQTNGIASQGDGVSILYRSIDESQFQSIAPVKVGNSGIYSWRIPDILHWGEYRLQVCISGGAMPATQNQVCSSEMPFSVTRGGWSMGAPIVINAPLAENELWQRGTWKDITWEDMGAPAGTRYDISVSDYSGGKGEKIVRGASANAGKGMVGWYVGSGESLADMSHPNPNTFGPGPWYVRINRSGETINTMSPGSFYMTEYCSQPASISDLRAVYDGNKVTLSWSPAQCAFGWNVYRSTDPSVPMGVSSTETLTVNLSPSKGSGTGFVDSASWDVSMGISPLSAGQTYYYKVVPLGTPAGNNSLSNIASVTI